MRQLEDALGEQHALHSTERHPLLVDDLLQIKRPLERELKNEISGEEEPEAAEVIDAVGSLYAYFTHLLHMISTLTSLSAISRTGKTNFFGQTANSWVRPVDYRSTCIAMVYTSVAVFITGMPCRHPPVIVLISTLFRTRKTAGTRKAALALNSHCRLTYLGSVIRSHLRKVLVGQRRMCGVFSSAIYLRLPKPKDWLTYIIAMLLGCESKSTSWLLIILISAVQVYTDVQR